MRLVFRQTNNCCAASRNLYALSNIIIDFHHIANRDKRKIIASMAVNVIISVMRLRRKNELSGIHCFQVYFCYNYAFSNIEEEYFIGNSKYFIGKRTFSFLIYTLM